jgi:hypothetical protein
LIFADPLGSLGERMILLQSDTLKISEEIRETTRWFEMEARGHTQVRGAKADVDAPIIGYSSANEVLTLRGDGRAKARVWTSPTSGQPPTTAELEELRYNLRTGELKTDKVSNVHIPLSPNIKFNAPPGPLSGKTRTKYTPPRNLP